VDVPFLNWRSIKIPKRAPEKVFAVALPPDDVNVPEAFNEMIAAALPLDIARVMSALPISQNYRNRYNKSSYSATANPANPKKKRPS